MLFSSIFGEHLSLSSSDSRDAGCRLADLKRGTHVVIMLVPSLVPSRGLSSSESTALARSLGSKKPSTNWVTSPLSLQGDSLGAKIEKSAFEAPRWQRQLMSTWSKGASIHPTSVDLCHGPMQRTFMANLAACNLRMSSKLLREFVLNLQRQIE